MITVHVQPRSGRRAVVGPHGGAIRIRVNEPAVDGRATEGARRLLAEVLGVAPGRVELHSGPRSRVKRFLVADGDLTRIATMLEDAPASG